MKSKILTKIIAVGLSACCLLSLYMIGADAAVIDGNSAALKNTQSTSSDEYPSSYSSKDLGYVTDVKSQKHSDCWAFAGLASFESKILRSGIQTDSMSENILNLWATKRKNSTGWQRDIFNDGYAEMVTGYLTSWQGAVEANLVEPVDMSGTVTGDDVPVNLAKYGVTSLKYVNGSDKNEVKKSIIDNGGLYASYSHSNQCQSSDMISYYMPPDFLGGGTGHAIEIVGWDDNYKKESFNAVENTLPQNDGAWLIKNSWGNYNSLNGYFWISYEDASLFSDRFQPCFSVESIQPITDNVRLEQNEIYGATYDFNYVKKDKVTYINKYDFSNGYNSLDKVIFETASKGAQYSIYYVPVEDDTPVDNTQKWTKLYSGTVSFNGYICADIQDFTMPVKKGAIAVSIDTANENADKSPTDADYLQNTFGVGEWLNKSDGTFIFKNDSKPGDSYILYDNTMSDLLDWYKVNNDDELGGTFVIKAVTNKTGAEITLAGDVDLNGKLTITDTTLLQKYLAGKEKLTAVKKLNADIDANGKIDISDATTIQKKLAGKI